MTDQKALANVQVVIEEWIAAATMLERDVLRPKGRLVYA
jgi:predicted RNase H-like HicB family nuclease